MAYAWTEIRNGSQVYNPGDTVDKSDFDEDDWEQLVDSRSVRNTPFPDMPKDWAGSPREWQIKQLTQQLEEAEDLLSEDDIAVLAGNETAALVDEDEETPEDEEVE